MAREEIVRIIDDLDKSDADETVKFGIDGVQYEIDLSTKNANKLRQALQPYVDSGRRLRGAGAATRTTRRRTTVSQPTDPEQNRAIREWAKSKKMDVSDRGRIKREIVEAYQASAGR